jgi:hypothetical protein
MAFLKLPDWLVHTFVCHLDADPWPLLDKARGKPIGTRSSKKQVREWGKLEARILGTKFQRHSDGSGSCSGS